MIKFVFFLTLTACGGALAPSSRSPPVADKVPWCFGATLLWDKGTTVDARICFGLKNACTKASRLARNYAGLARFKEVTTCTKTNMTIDSLVILSYLGRKALHQVGPPTYDVGDYADLMVQRNYLQPPLPAEGQVAVPAEAVSQFIGTVSQCHFLASWVEAKCPVVRSPYGEDDRRPAVDGPLVLEIKGLGIPFEGGVAEHVYYSSVGVGGAAYRVGLGRKLLTLDEIIPFGKWGEVYGSGLDADSFLKARRFISYVSHRLVSEAPKFGRYPSKKSKARKMQSNNEILPRLAELS